MTNREMNNAQYAKRLHSNVFCYFYYPHTSSFATDKRMKFKM